MAEWGSDSTLAQVFAVTCAESQKSTKDKLCEERVSAGKGSGK